MFSLNIGVLIDGSCYGCHSGGNKILFLQGNNAANRTAILKFTGATAQAFIDKMGGTTSHGGGVQPLTAAMIQPWFNQEKIGGN